MTEVTHHIPDALIAAYAAGALAEPFALVVAAHISLCDSCRAAYHSHLELGGAVLETIGAETLSDGLRAEVFAALDAPAPAPPVQAARSGIYPAPVVEALGGKAPRWRPMGMGVRQALLGTGGAGGAGRSGARGGRGGSARLLYIPPGRAVPDHGHNGLELTLVLQGAFADETGRFGVGDVEVADATLDHTPVADEGAPCICLAATDSPLRFNTAIPRLLQPVFRI